MEVTGSIPRRAALAGIGALAGTAVRLAPAAAQTLTPIHIATAETDGAAVPFYAEDLGFFQSAGLDPQITTATNGAAIAAAIVAGTYDIGWSAILSLAQAHERGLPVAVIFPATAYTKRNPVTILAVAKDSPIRGPQDFAGKTIAVNGIGPLQQMALMTLLADHGGDPKSLRFVEISNTALVPALDDHRVDVIMMTEPFVAMNKDKIRILSGAFDGISPSFITGAWFVAKPWAAAHPALVSSVVGVLKRGAQWANTHHAESAKILVKYTKVDPQVASVMVRTEYPEQMDTASVQHEIDLAARYGFLKASFPVAELLYSV